MKQIPLTRGAFALVDDEDYVRLSKHKWCAMKREGKLYAARIVYLHREIAGITEAKMCVDHKNGVTLDDQKHNLRPATASQNGANRKLQINNTTGYKGVERHRKNFSARIQCQEKREYIGSFSSPEAAARAYDAAAIRLFGEFASLNFPRKKNQINEKNKTIKSNKL